MQSSTAKLAEELHSSYLASSDWYWNHARPILDEHAPERVQEFEKQLETLEQLAKIAKEPFTACFLGQSQIGKSTLINALVADDKVLLPAGGIGPLTAQAIKVSYSATPFLEVSYQERQKIRDLRLVLESYLVRRNATAAEITPAASSLADEEGELSSEDILDLAAVEEATAFTPAMTERIKQATLLITGDQNSNRTLEYVCDAIRLALGLKPKWNTAQQAEDIENIQRLASILEANSAAVFHSDNSAREREFIQQSRLHSAGALAPMVRDLSIGWPSPLLQSGVRLVDLPGVGVADDAHRTVTRSWVKEKANAVGLVVTQSGIDEASAELLRSSEFLTRLLYSINDPSADPVRLFVIVVKMDDLAHARFDEEKARSPEQYRRKVEHLREACLAIKPVVCSRCRVWQEASISDSTSLKKRGLRCNGKLELDQRRVRAEAQNYAIADHLGRRRLCLARRMHEGMQPYDCIGGVHGQADLLIDLLRQLGYTATAGTWRPPERKAIFLGDFIDLGPKQIETVMIARRMVEGGSALAVMGNHELNAIAWFLPDPANPEDYLRSHNSPEWGGENRHQHAAFLAAVEGHPKLHSEIIDWFLTLPLWLDLPDLRVVHACWQPNAIEYLSSRIAPGATLTPDLMTSIASG